MYNQIHMTHHRFNHSTSHLFYLLAIGVFLMSVKTPAQNRSEDLAAQSEDSYIIVESNHILNQTTQDTEYELEPYIKRRNDWGVLVGLGYSTYEPLSYDPNFTTDSFSDVYEGADFALLELILKIKKNFSFFSLGLELSVGSYSSESVSGALSDLSLLPLRIGAYFSLDNLIGDALIVPYASIGAYTILYKEVLDTSLYEGNTQVSYYYSAGIMYNLNHLEPSVAKYAYKDFGMQNTFLFAEARQFIASEADKDPNFESDIYASVGLNIEF